ncbi:hypothetical protein CHL76_10875 [Marinococcus halophilus]|uniref:Uncharacterized protein n=1 Tax=Marinococcus halophilus TaxID=1371 RepID=A0A510Y7Q1_MARHA|nr:hypothetical protein [Marinococcus halophilus]OZT79885.1 hypothetical protein CHL76_10875 [Marinococcus halophilus]GEK58711.1 hypothetical protein MHA01_16160 [Marinococcus halophilus]
MLLSIYDYKIEKTLKKLNHLAEAPVDKRLKSNLPFTLYITSAQKEWLEPYMTFLHNEKLVYVSLMREDHPLEGRSQDELVPVRLVPLPGLWASNEQKKA